MNVYNEINLDIDENEVIRLLGYKEATISEEILKEVKTAIDKSQYHIELKSIHRKLDIVEKDDINNVIRLDNGVEFRGTYIYNNLKKCNYIVVDILTAGEGLDKLIEDAFATGDFLTAMIYDSIGTYVVTYAGRVMWSRFAKQAVESNVGITNRMSPGDFGWNIEQQIPLFKCIDAEHIGVTLNESCLMNPAKSVSTIYGFGEGIGIGKQGHTCKDCKLKECILRGDKTVKVTVINEGVKKTIQVEREANLLEALRANDYMIDSPCNGKGICGKCKVMCTKMAPKPSEYDITNLTEKEIEAGYRLACGVTVTHPIELLISNNNKQMNVLKAGTKIDVPINHQLRKKYISIESATIADQTDDCRRIIRASNEEINNVNLDTISKIHSIIKKNKDLTVVIDGDTIINVEEGDTTDTLYGVAIDIGTTTVVVYLIDMLTGNEVDVISGMNEQSKYGSDVATRIQHTMDKADGLEIMHSTIINQLNKMVEEVCVRNNISITEIYDSVIVGNTTMIHLLANIPVEGIGVAPYVPVFTDYIAIKPNQIGLRTKGSVKLINGLSSYIGSDIVAGILSSKMYTEQETVLLLDLGTNGEMALGNKDKIITCSTAAGPAFEGASIKYGVGGINGAISEVDFNGDTIYKTIGSMEPSGICGSGVLDIVSQLIQHKLMDETGRIYDIDEIEKDNSCINLVSENEEGKCINIYSSQNQLNDIYFTQKDIREVQLAKAAIYAGIKILVKEFGITVEEIDKVYIAGGFGNFMNVRSAVDIGLIPNEIADKVYSIGNSAGTGAKMCLLSLLCREDINKFLSKTQYVELSTRMDFQEFFVDGMIFGG